MTIDDKIVELLNKQFPNDKIEVINESYKHLGHGGDNGTGQTHYNVTIASKQFDGLSRVQQQRLVNQCLKPLMGGGKIHALNIKTIVAK